MQKLQAHAAKGFTLVELLIVIAIVAILAVVVILTLNPAQLLAQARDSARISDLGNIKSALALYLADGKTFTAVVAANCYTNATPAPGINCTDTVARHALKTTTNVNSVAVDGSGWIPVNFGSISSGAPFGSIPKDPTSNATYFYSFVGDPTVNDFELDANMESTKYAQGGGSSDVESTDGGNVASVYETGSKTGLTY